MGDHFVLLVDRLITKSTLEAAIESRNQAKLGTAGSLPEIAAQKNAGDRKGDEKLVECRICQDGEEDSNMETLCSCCSSLKMCSYSSMDGVLYCKLHFEQLFKETGSFTMKFQTPSKSDKELSRTPSRVSTMFSGTQDKCAVCNKTAYPLEKVSVEGSDYHKNCFKCSHRGCILTPSSYAALDGILYCKHHFVQLFKEKGSYNHLIKTASMKKNFADPVVPPDVVLTDPAEPEAESQPETTTDQS